MQSQQSSNFDTPLLVRLATLEQQLKQVQELLKQLQDQQRLYVSEREYNIQLQGIQGSVSRIERDVVDMKSKLEAQEKEFRDRDENQKSALASAQFRIVMGVLTFVAGIVSALIIFYITHFKF